MRTIETPLVVDDLYQIINVQVGRIAPMKITQFPGFVGVLEYERVTFALSNSHSKSWSLPSFEEQSLGQSEFLLFNLCLVSM